MTERVAQLPWDQLHHTQGDIPWSALESFAELVPTDHELVEALFHAYDEARVRPFEEPRYVDLYVPAVFALAAPRLGNEQRQEIGEFLVGKLVEAAREDDDLMAETLVAACGAMGPVILPAVLDAISNEPDSFGAWFYLWDLTALAAETQDPHLQDQTVQACVALLERVDRGEVETDVGMGAGWTLAYLGKTEYTELLQRLSRKSGRVFGGADYEAAANLLQGRQDSQRQSEMWQVPVQQWLTSHWETARDWFARRSAEALEDLEVVEADVPDPHRLIRLFMTAPWATGLPEDLRADAPFIVGRLLEYAETYEGTAATELDERTLRNVLLDVFPRKLTGDRDFFAKVAPVTEAFLGWMGSEGLLTDASALVQTVHGWAQEIVTAAMDPRHWGPAKSETMKAVQAGVDMSDEDALRGFLFEQVLRSLEETPAADTYEPPPAPTAPIKEHTPRVGRNDPCPCGSGRKYKKCCGDSTRDLTANT